MLTVPCAYSPTLTKESRTANVNITTGMHVGALRLTTSPLTAYGESAIVSYPVNLVFLAHSFSHLEGSSTSMGHPGYCHCPLLSVKNADVR